MRYALRKQDKIAAAIGDDYLKNHILKSLDSFFRKSNDECIISSVELDTYQTESGESYAVLRVNDLADDNAMLEFAVIGKEFDKVNKENKDPELESINSFNDTVKKANEIKDRVLKYVDKIKQERAYNIDLCMTFERYIEIADKDAERAMAFLKEAYPFNEETEVFIRKRYNMSIDVDPEEN